MLRLLPSEKAQKAKDQHTLDQATQRSLGQGETRQNTYAARGPGIPDAIDERMLLQVKTRWNMRAPISKIPNEILLAIFMIMKEDEEFSFTDLHRIAQICGRWRVVAVNTPALWNDLPTGLHQYSLIMLERSKSLPLSVELVKGMPIVIIPAILTHMDRIRKLVLHLPAKGLMDAQEFLAKQGHLALRLEELIVKRDDTSDYHTWFTFCLDAFRPTNQLRRLSLVNKFIHDWDILTCHKLTHLTIRGVCSTRRISLRSFMESLRLITELQTLEIDLEATDFEEPTETGLLLEHPKLCSLGIRGGFYQHSLIDFLAHTAFPSLNQLYIDHKTDDGTDRSEMLLAISHTLERGQFGIPYALYMLSDCVSLYCREDAKYSTQAPPQFELDMWIDTDDRLGFSDYAFVRDVLDWTIRMNDGISSPLVAIRPDSFMRFTATEFAQLFEQLPKLEEITVSDNTITFLIAALSDDPEGTQFPSFPGLRRIHWWRGRRFSLPTLDTLSPSIFKDFARSLQIRQRRNLAIHSLHLRGSFEQHEIDLLSGGVLKINISER